MTKSKSMVNTGATGTRPTTINSDNAKEIIKPNGLSWSGSLSLVILSYFQHIKGRGQNAFSRKGAILLHALVRAEGYIKPLFGLCNNQWGALRPCWKLQICKRGPYCRSALCSHTVSSSAKMCVAEQEYIRRFNKKIPEMHIAWIKQRSSQKACKIQSITPSSFI